MRPSSRVKDNRQWKALQLSGIAVLFEVVSRTRKTMGATTAAIVPPFPTAAEQASAVEKFYTSVNA
jgi:hypothetical protein